MKKYQKGFLLLALLLMPIMVFASESSSGYSLGEALLMESFLTIFMSVFVFLPLSKIFFKEKSTEAFWTLFVIRAIILLFFDFYITPNIALVDFYVVIIGSFTIIPIYISTTIVKEIKKLPVTENIGGTLMQENTQTTITQCVNCHNTIDNPSANFCKFCGKPLVVKQVVQAAPQPKTNIVKKTDFEPIYSLSEEQMLDSFINQQIAKYKLDENNKMVPETILKRKKKFNIIFVVLLFVYTTMFFFHFPIATYAVGLVILFILFKATRNYNLIKYLKKEIKARPNEKISNILMTTKSTFVEDNTTRKFVASIIIAIFTPLLIFIQPRIIYEKVDNGYAVRYYLFGLTNFRTAKIPATYKNKNIVGLRGNTFSNMYLLNKVELPDTITEIRGQAFKNCFSLTEVNIPKKLEYLGGGAFYNASNIKMVELPNTLTYIGGEAFYGASSLEYINLPPNILEIRGDTFSYCISLKEISIPDKVTRIGGHAFYGAASLKEVKISENSKLQEIGSSAFRMCDNLYKIKIPKYTYVNERAFKESPTIVERYGDLYNNNYYDYDYYNNYDYREESVENVPTQDSPPEENNQIEYKKYY